MKQCSICEMSVIDMHFHSRFECRGPAKKILEDYSADFEKKILLEIADFFNWNIYKTLLWFTTENPGLGNITPMDMIRNDRSDKLLKFIKASKDGNFP